MLRRHALKAGLAAGMQPLLGLGAARAQSGKPIEWVVGFAAGGGSDAVARSVGEAWGQELGRTVVILNKPGAGTNIAAEYAARPRDPGYLVFMADFATLAANPHLFSKLAYNAQKDFVPIGLLSRSALFLVVGTQLPVHSLQEFTAWAKARTGAVSYASAGLGTPHHLATELLARRLQLKMSHVPYRGAAPALLDVIGGQVPFMLADSAAVVQHIAAGKVRAIGVASAQRLKSHPQVPTLAEQGLKDFEAHAWQGLVAPAGTDEATVQAWSEALQQALRSPAVQARFEALALEPLPGTPAQMRDHWHSESLRWGQIIASAGIRLD